LSQLLGGKHFTVPCKIAQNGYAIQTSALADSGANGFVFIDTRFARELMKFLNTTTTTLAKPYTVKGYDGRPGKPVSEVLTLHLEVDGRRQKDIPMLVLDLGSHDLILGRKWFTHFDVWLDVRNQRLLWPRARLTEPAFAREICTPRENLRTNTILPRHQEDVVKRERAFILEDKRRADGKRPVTILKAPTKEKMISDPPKDTSKLIDETGRPRQRPSPRTQQ
jgi:predicted aspartyl protease